MEAEIVLQPTHDYGGADEWCLAIFDLNGDQSETVFDIDMGTFSWCVLEAANYISKHNDVQHKVVIERIM